MTGSKYSISRNLWFFCDSRAQRKLDPIRKIMRHAMATATAVMVRAQTGSQTSSRECIVCLLGSEYGKAYENFIFRASRRRKLTGAIVEDITQRIVI